MILKIFALLTFMFGAIVAGLWIPLELAGAVTEGSDWVWYLALVFMIIPMILCVIVAARTRTRVSWL